MLLSLIMILLIRLFALLLLSVHLVSSDALLIAIHRKVDAQLCGVLFFQQQINRFFFLFLLQDFINIGTITN